MAGIELHDEIVEWMANLDTSEWARTVIVIDRLADLGSMARMPFSRALGELSQRELAERMGTTQSVISRLEEGARNRLDTLGRVAVALNRHLVVSFPEVVPKRLKDAVQVA